MAGVSCGCLGQGLGQGELSGRLGKPRNGGRNPPLYDGDGMGAMQRDIRPRVREIPIAPLLLPDRRAGNGLLRDQRQRRQVFYRQIHSRFMYCQRQILLRIFLPTGRACLRGLARSQEKPSARNRMPRLCLKNGRRKTPILAAVSMNMWSWIKSDRQP